MAFNYITSKIKGSKERQKKGRKEERISDSQKSEKNRKQNNKTH